MRFYSKIIKKPESVISEVKHGLKIVSRPKLCQFINGVCEVDDPKVIEKLKEHPERYRTDKPWPVVTEWKDTEEGKEMLAKGERLGIKIKNIRKEYLIKLIEEKEKKQGILTEKVKAKVLGYKELIIKAKALDINPYGKKKEVLIEEIKEKEVILNVH